MLVRFDESLQRLVSLFLAPVLNVALLSFMLTYSLAGTPLTSLTSGIDTGGLSAYLLNIGRVLLSGQYQSVSDLLSKQGDTRVKVSGVLLLVIFFGIIGAIFFIDRIIYLLVCLVPFIFTF